MLDELLYEVKPRLKEFGELRGKKLIEDMGFDSIDIIELISLIEETLGTEISDIENLLDIIQEYDRLEKWLSKRM